MATVFLSYAHSTPGREQTVATVVAGLREMGLTVLVDLDVDTPQGPPEGWPRWMKNQLRRADWVLMFFDETYRRRFDGLEESGRGLGASWEGAIITSAMYRSHTNERFIPLIDDDGQELCIPDELLTFTRYRVPSDTESLARKLAKDPGQGDVATKADLPTIMRDEAWARNTLDDARRRAKNRKKKFIKELIVDRAELDDLIHAVRLLGSRSVTSLSGDLSWLESDLPRLRDLRQRKPTLRLVIFFDKNDVSPEAAPLLKAVEDLRVDLKPYPVPVTRLKCLLLDAGGDSARAFTFRRIGSAVDGEKPQSFVWCEYGPGDHTVESIKALVTSLTFLHADPLKIAIVGVNNVGKSSIASRLKAVLRSRFAVEVTDDVFKIANYDTTVHDNLLMLWKQQLMEDAASHADIRIFDRCLIDNYCFLKVRVGKLTEGSLKVEAESLCGRLSGDIVNQSHKYDLVVDVQRSDHNYGDRTDRVLPDERFEIRRALDQFFRDHHIEPFIVHTETRNDELDVPSVERAANTIAAEISRLAIRRRIATK